VRDLEAEFRFLLVGHIGRHSRGYSKSLHLNLYSLAV
jgi:hypothetical protein